MKEKIIHIDVYGRHAFIHTDNRVIPFSAKNIDISMIGKDIELIA